MYFGHLYIFFGHVYNIDLGNQDGDIVPASRSGNPLYLSVAFSNSRKSVLRKSVLTCSIKSLLYWLFRTCACKNVVADDGERREFICYFLEVIFIVFELAPKLPTALHVPSAPPPHLVRAHVDRSPAHTWTEKTRTCRAWTHAHKDTHKDTHKDAGTHKDTQKDTKLHTKCVMIFTSYQDISGIHIISKYKRDRSLEKAF
jgi:hypothetical protein